MATEISARPRLVFLCESGTDVRLVDGLAERFALTVLGRDAFGPRLINWPSKRGAFELVRGPADRVRFGTFAFRWLLDHRRQHDLVLAQNQGIATLAALQARRATGAPVISFLCSPNSLYFRCRWTKRELALPMYLGGRIALWTLRQGCALSRPSYVVLSRHLAEVADPAGRARVGIIPIYGVDGRIFTRGSVADRRAARKRLGLEPGCPVLFFSSRIAAEKDTETLLDAVRILVGRGVRLGVVNASGGYEQFLELARSRGIGEVCRGFPAAHPHEGLRDFYWAADVCVQASLEEGLGFSPLESLACGTPVIASAVGGLRETIVAGETGLSVPPRSPAALAEALNWAFEHPDEMQSMAKRGADMVQREFDSQHAFDRFGTFVDEILGRA